MAVSRKASLLIGCGLLWLGGWSAWQAALHIVDLTRWVDGLTRLAADMLTGLAVGALIGGLVMLGALGASLIGHAAAPRVVVPVLLGGSVIAAVCGVLAGVLSFAAR